MIKTNAILTALIFLLVCFASEQAFAQTPATAPTVSAAKAEKFLRTELYFGRSKPDGTIISDDDWNKFLAGVVTPRFPDGFTVLPATGHYREKGGRIITEPSEVLIFLYDRKTRTITRRKIEEIRNAYLKQFSQESVLRMDLRQSVRVFF